MTDEELLRIYAEAAAKNFPDSGISDGLRAVFLAGARAQREMEPTDEMLELVGTVEGWDGKIDEADENHREWFRAMQRVAPLVGGGGEVDA